MIAATILAAGESSRMGSPKALLQYRGRTFLETILRILQTLGLHSYVAVSRNTHIMLENHDLSGVTIVTNRELAAGPIGSIRASIRAIEGRSYDGLLVWPVDLPHVSEDTIRAMIDRFQHEQDTTHIVVPSFQSKRGHPVIFGNGLFEELLQVPDSIGARAVVRSDPGRVVQVPVADPAIVDQINTPEEYRALLRDSRE